MEKFFFKKVEVWFVALCILVLSAATLFFGTLVRDETEARANHDRPAAFGRAGKWAYRIAGIPQTLTQLLSEGDPLAAGNPDRFGDKSGWTKYHDLSAEAGYLLLSRTEGRDHAAVVELVRLADLSVLHSWIADPAVLFAGAKRALSSTDYTQWQPGRFRLMHPLPEADGSLVVHGQQSPLVRIDYCSRRTMLAEEIHAHHALNVDADGNLWAPVEMQAVHGSKSQGYEDDALGEFSHDGKLLFTRSITDLLTSKGMAGLVIPAYDFQKSNVHLNDIQPALQDGPYWKKGDVFVSLRRPSMIFLYRPATDEILWQKQGPWVLQHDVDILDDHRISVFNNNVVDRGKGAMVDGHTDILVYDFATDRVTKPYEAAMSRERVAAESNGLVDMTESGNAIVEEDTAGRIMIFGPDQTLLADFINRGPDGKIFRMGWSRYVTKNLGDQIMRSISAAAPCK